MSRVWSYWLGGKDNYAADRAVGDAVTAAYPGTVELVRSSRRFLERTVRHLAAECGIRQFIEIGLGLPADQNVHLVAQAVVPDARVVYVDNDPFVLMHARAMLTDTGPGSPTGYVDVDHQDPDAVLAAAGTHLDLSEPVAVLFMGRLGNMQSLDDARRVVRRIRDGVAPGSYLALWGASDTSDEVRAAAALQSGMVQPYRLHTVEELARYFDGLELVEPGVVMINDWRPDSADRRVQVDGYGGVGRIVDGEQASVRGARGTAAPDSAPTRPGLLRTDTPQPARMWNYWLGGKDNYAADRTVAEAVIAVFPDIVPMARHGRQFLVRTVRHLAEAGVRQFLDIGAGLPTSPNTHEIAQAVDPDARVAYVDNDPLAQIHSRALLDATSAGATAYIDADYRRPAALLEKARAVLDFDEPIGVMFFGVFGYLEDAADMHAVVATVLDAVVPGSYLALWDGTTTSAEARAAMAAQAVLGSPYQLRSVSELEQCFAGLDMVEPGLVNITQWRPDPDGPAPPVHIDGYGGVGRKP